MNTISEEKMAIYRATAQRRVAEEKEQNYQRYLHGWAVAAKGAALLKEKYHATQVLVFGSLLDEELIHGRSDIDLAAWGTDAMVYYRIVADMLSLDTAFLVDFVRMEEAKPSLFKVITEEGKVI